MFGRRMRLRASIAAVLLLAGFIGNVRSAVGACEELLLNRKDLHLKNIIVVAAMDVEHSAILSDRTTEVMTLSAVHDIQSHIMWRGSTKIRILKSGVGPVNAALALGFALNQEPADAVFLIGVGGALVPHLEIGDLVIAESVIQHDSIYSGEQGIEHMAPGELFLSRTKQTEFTDPVIRTNPELVNLIYRSYSEKEGRVFKGPMASGGEFVASFERKAALSQRTNGTVMVDMEAGAIAQLCRKQRTPFVVAKTIADRLNPDGTISSDYKIFLKSAAERAARLIDLLFNDR